ncbi:MAG: DNA methyltransferase, partial [Verrucomicrobiota bacterium]
LEKAKKEPLNEKEIRMLNEALLHSRQPWLEWSSKREKKTFEVDPVALHIHEKVSARAIMRAAERDDLEEDLFGTQELDREAEKQFYQHDVDWANRLILGDSLQVMTSLSRREGLAGQVQMIYIDPPYGISFKSNWQNEIGKHTVKDGDGDVARSAEVIKAYRDTWTMGVHSYLSYLKQRLVLARELLTDSGSVFVQIGDENLHRVRTLVDEVFGAENEVAIIALTKTTGAGSPEVGTKTIPSICDFIVWSAKSKGNLKYKQLHKLKVAGEEGATRYKPVASRGGALGTSSDIRSQSGGPTAEFKVEFCGKEFRPHPMYWKTNVEGVRRLIGAERLFIEGKTLRYLRLLDDYPASPLNNVWTDIGGIQSRSDPKVYAVQSATKIVERCMLMTTDPGDLVFDPTSGSGTSAYAAEQWGRRWIAIDSSRVAVAIARQRMLTSKFESYKTLDPREGAYPNTPRNPGSGFVYKTVAHITLKSIAQNQSLDPIFAKYGPKLDESLEALNAALNDVDDDCKSSMVKKLVSKHREEGASSISEADKRRWLLPGTSLDSISAVKGGGGLKPITVKQAEVYRTYIPSADGWKQWEVPFDDDPDWPEHLQRALVAHRNIWQEKMEYVNGSIEANSDQEELVDQPEIVKGVVRVSGPFTVESVRPLEKSLRGGVEPDSPIGGAPEELESFDDDDLSFTVEETGVDYETDSDIQLTNAAGHLDRMMALLKQDGLTFPGNKHIVFEPLNLIESEFLHAEGEFTPDGGGDKRSAGIVIGPEHGAVTAFQANSAIFQAIARNYDDLFFAAFSFDATAQDKIQEANENDATPLRVHMAMIRPDVLMGDLLKGNTAKKKKAATEQTTQQLFTVFGQPRTRIEKTGDEFVVHMEGMDVYDPVKNEIVDTKAGKVAAWFLDSDYDGKTFCISQAFFPDKDAWTKLAKSLKETKEEDLASVLEKMTGGTSLPFEPGEHRRVAVKVIDPRGNEVLRVHNLEL